MAFWTITRQLRTAIELYREAIRFTAKSKVQNSFYGIQRECLDEWLCETWRGSAGSDSMPSATVALKKPFKSFSLFLSLSLSLAKTMSIKFSTRVKQKQTPENQRENYQQRNLQPLAKRDACNLRRPTKKQTNPKSAAAILFQMLCTAFFLSSNDHLLMCTV